FFEMVWSASFHTNEGRRLCIRIPYHCHAHSPAVMINLLGSEGHNGNVIYRGSDKVFECKGAYLHLYGKKQTKPFRKMGHITICGEDLNELISNAQTLKKAVRIEAD
ncbi:MAG: hypothetical protein RIC15_03550, partial [Vicingaceae bacterium]